MRAVSFLFFKYSKKQINDKKKKNANREEIQQNIIENELHDNKFETPGEKW